MLKISILFIGKINQDKRLITLDKIQLKVLKAFNKDLIKVLKIFLIYN